jgi:hypothetical protein
MSTVTLMLWCPSWSRTYAEDSPAWMRRLTPFQEPAAPETAFSFSAASKSLSTAPGSDSKICSAPGGCRYPSSSGVAPLGPSATFADAIRSRTGRGDRGRCRDDDAGSPRGVALRDYDSANKRLPYGKRNQAIVILIELCQAGTDRTRRARRRALRRGTGCRALVARMLGRRLL